MCPPRNVLVFSAFRYAFRVWEQTLNEMNKIDTIKPWSLTFSYGRALQQSCLKAWKGEAANVGAAQAELTKRAKANSEAQQGIYAGGVEGAASASSTFVKNYSY